ncbi:MAG: GntR family transcriptional regulator [Deltaproteobacteria bacterium]|nr:GntR family transcriptional regulator [Deltaproteobacteria bacterium]
MKLNRDHIPLYFQLQQILRKKILSDKIAPDEALPTESEICKDYSVSRTTVRQAFAALLNEGLITRIPGKGTFINQQNKHERIVHSFNTTGSFIDASSYAKLEKKIHYRGLVAPSVRLMDIFDLEQGQKVFCLRGTRYQNEIPLCYFAINFSGEHAHHFRGKRLKTEILFSVIEKELGMSLNKVHRTIRASKADEHAAKYLEINKGDPVLELEQIYYVGNNVAVEVGINYFHADRYDYVMELKQKK